MPTSWRPWVISLSGARCAEITEITWPSMPWRVTQLANRMPHSTFWPGSLPPLSLTTAVPWLIAVHLSVRHATGVSPVYWPGVRQMA